MDSVGKWLVLKHWSLKRFSASQDISLGQGCKQPSLARGLSEVRAACACCFTVSYFFLFPSLQRNTTS